MVRPRKDRPKRYKSYVVAFEEAQQNDIPPVPESTIRSQRKRKLRDVLLSSSSSGDEDDSEHNESGLDQVNSELETESHVDAEPCRALEGDEDHRSQGSTSSSSPNNEEHSFETFQPGSDTSSDESNTDDGLRSKGASKTRPGTDERPYHSIGSKTTELASDIPNEDSNSDNGEGYKGCSESSLEPEEELISANGSRTFVRGSDILNDEVDSELGTESEGGAEANIASEGENHRTSASSSNDIENTSRTFEPGSEIPNEEVYASYEIELEGDVEASEGEDRTSSSSPNDEENTSRTHESDSDIPSDVSNSDGVKSNDGSETRFEAEERPIDPYCKLRMSLQGTFREPLNATVTLSVGEILTNVLTLVKKHNWNHREKEDLMKFTGALLNDQKILPTSRFLLDKLFFSKKGMRYFFYCSECTHFLLDVEADSHAEATISCPNQKCTKENNLSDLSKATYFVVFDIPSQLNILFENPEVRKKLVNPLDHVNKPEDNIMRDLYDGSCYRSFANDAKNLASATSKIISFSLSVDSASLCSFSGQSICPCFLMVNELPTVLRMKNLLIAGLWFGLKKEKMDLFLPPIVSHLKKLSTEGFFLQFQAETWHFLAFLIACVADSVARCDVQGIHAHRGDYPCSWCLCEGEEYINSRIFPHEITLPPPRTIEGMLADSRTALEEKIFVRGVKYFTPLASAPLFHPVHGFVVDQMHAKDEGTTKAFLNSWLGEDGKTAYRIKKANVAKINALLNEVRIPKELRKGVRSLTQVKYWTGREMENWCLFLSLSVLPDFLPEQYLKHWALYVQGTYLLLSTEIHEDVVNLAEVLLEEFCINTESLYGRHMLRFNLHILRHFAENCRRWGPLFALSAYQFEAGNQRLKKLVHDCNGIPNQVCRGLSEDNALLILKNSCESDITRAFAKATDSQSHAHRVKYVGTIQLLGAAKPFKPSVEEEDLFNRMHVDNLQDCVQYMLLKKDGCHYGPGRVLDSSKIDNSYIQLSNKKIVCIKKIIHKETTNDCWIIANRVRVTPSKYCPLVVVRYDPSLCCHQVVSSIDEDVSVYDVSQISNVCVNMPFAHGHFLSAMPNIFNMF